MHPWLVCAVATGTASAAQVTDMPPELGLYAGLRYGGSSVSGHLEEAGEEVGGRKVSRHDLDLFAEFAPVRGIAFNLDLAYTPSLSYRYPGARSMVVEPLTGSGSYLAGEVGTDTPTVKASGLDGLWLGVAAAPVSEGYGTSQRANWRIDAGFRTPSPNRNLWTTRNGNRGPAEGGSAIRLAGAFSTTRGVVSPWMRGGWTRESPVKVDVVDEAGVTWAKDLPLRPASTFAADVGVDVVAVEDASTGLRFAVGLSFGAGYKTWEDVASGVYLPNVLDGGRRIPMTSGDRVFGQAAIDADLHLNEVIRFDTGLAVDYGLPYRLEHVYEVRTSPDTIELGWTFAVTAVGLFAAREPEALDP
ncbi:MAG: hypothetical protein ABMB14_12435 [Myxococcota bacterium]